jgi:integrase
MRVYKRTYRDGRQSKDYYYSFYHRDKGSQLKQIKKRGTPNKEETKNLAIAHKTALLKGELGISEKKREPIKFDELTDRFLKYSKSNKRSWERDETSINALKRVFSGKSIDKISPQMIERYRDNRKARVTGSSVNRELACLKTMFSKAILWDLADENPVKRIKFLRENKPRSRYLNREEIKALLDNCTDHLRPIVIFALNTGMRLSEVLGLTWDRVNLQEGIAELRETKTGDVRHVPLTPDARVALDMVEGGNKYVFTYGKEPLLRVSRSFATACRGADIENFRFHDLRHTWASYFMMNGGNLYDLMVMGGWKSISMVKRYSHLDRQYRMRIMNIASPTTGIVRPIQDHSKIKKFKKPVSS